MYLVSHFDVLGSERNVVCENSEEVFAYISEVVEDVGITKFIIRAIGKMEITCNIGDDCIEHICDRLK